MRVKKIVMFSRVMKRVQNPSTIARQAMVEKVTRALVVIVVAPRVKNMAKIP